MSKSYEPARKRIVELVEGAVPTTKAKGLGDRFVHDPRAGGAVVSAARKFHLHMTAGALRGPFRPRANVVRLVADLIVEYGSFADREALDVAVVEDFVVIASALGGGDWQFDTSNIRIVGGENAADIFTMTVEEPSAGATRLRIRFPVEVRIHV